MGVFFHLVVLFEYLLNLLGVFFDGLSELLFGEVCVVPDELVPYFGEKIDGCLVVVFNLGNYGVLFVHSFGKFLNCVHCLSSQAFPSVFGNCDHDVDLGFILLNPLGEEQIYVSNHFPILGKNDESVLGWIFKPRPMIIKLFLQRQWLRASQVKELRIQSKPLMVFLHIAFAIRVENDGVGVQNIVYFFCMGLGIHWEI